MLRSLLAAAVIVSGAGMALAQNTAVIKERQSLLEAMGKAAKDPGMMMKGEEDFDLAKIKGSLKVYQNNASKLGELFPDDSKTGEKTEALPVIWDEKKDFTDRFLKLVADAKAADGAITDAATFEGEWPKVMGNCSSCHKKYRKPKE